ncbi:MAG: hypothetical protein PHR35_06845 [Kiritimatiellae bacterium]|nr:hypothetical protein [Kiritimatiellia bacterium]
MQPQHERAVARLRAAYEPDDRYLALIVVGSVAAGTASDDADVDHIVVVTDEEFTRRMASETVHYWTRDLCDYPGGYVEGKFVNRNFVVEAAARGSEPARAQFAGAMVVFSKIPGLDALVRQISVYPEKDRERKIRSFYAQLKVLRDYLQYGEQRGDRFIVLRAAAGIALFGGRLILAHNRILYPYHKWFMREVRKAPAQPPELQGLLDAFLAAPSTAACDSFCACIVAYMQLQRFDDGFISRFVMDTEWSWLLGGGPVEDW